MNNGLNNRKQSAGGELVPDPALKNLLGSLDPPGEILSWDRVERIVADAPPVRPPWYAGLAAGDTRVARFAVAPVAIMLAVCVLWMMPAQSDSVGTIALTTLPSTWDTNSAAFEEVREAAYAGFKALNAADSELFIKVGPSNGRNQIAFAMVNVDRETAKGFYNNLAGKYPGFQAFEVEYTDIDSGRYGNLLNELVSRITHPGEAVRSDSSMLKLFVLKELKQAGFTNIKVEVIEKDNGAVVLEIDATLEIPLEGLSIDELRDLGLEEDLGNEAFDRLAS